MRLVRPLICFSVLAVCTAPVVAGCGGSTFVGQDDGGSGTSSGVGSSGAGGTSGSSATGGASGSATTGQGSGATSGVGGGSGSASGGGSGSASAGGSSGTSASGTGGTSGSSTGGTSCTSSANCGHNQVCAFPASEGCAAKGKCVPAPTGPVCLAYAAGCACDGSEINIACTGLPSGYESKPLLHNGPCALDAGIGKDAGSGGGQCCPVGWNLYSCTYVDGGAGQACHNPALGCASSLTCGQGCDSVVTGRCP